MQEHTMDSRREREGEIFGEHSTGMVREKTKEK